MRSITSVSIFDQNIIRTSAAGSCVLRIVEALAGDIPLHLYANRTDAPESKLVRKTKIPLPPGPMGRRPSISISAEGTFPFRDLCYEHFCHRVFLHEHRDSIGGGALRRTARILNHTSAAFTERIAFRSARIIVARQGSLRGFSERCGETGWVIERTTESIAAPIVQAASDRPRLRRIGAAARKQVEKYSGAEFRRRWRELLESLVVA